jgi:hypothetical protein
METNRDQYLTTIILKIPLRCSREGFNISCPWYFESPPSNHKNQQGSLSHSHNLFWIPTFKIYGGGCLIFRGRILNSFLLAKGTNMGSMSYNHNILNHYPEDVRGWGLGSIFHGHMITFWTPLYLSWKPKESMSHHYYILNPTPFCVQLENHNICIGSNSKIQVDGNVRNSRVLWYYNPVQLKIWLVVIFCCVILMMSDCHVP